MKAISMLVFLLSLGLPAAAGLAAEPQPPRPVTPVQTRQVPVAAHLGAMVVPLPPALAVQLPAVVPKGQGVMVARVEPGASAETAGLRPYDLLLSYDDQKLYVPAQLSRLVTLDRPGREVVLTLVRGGEIVTIQTTLGEAPISPFIAHPQQAWPFAVPHLMQPTAAEQRQKDVSESFESLNVEKRGDGSYRASIEYLEKDGVKRSFKFEGTGEELRRQIGETKAIAPAARRHLLDAIDMNDTFPMPHLWGPLRFNDLMRAWSNGEWMQY